MKELLEKFKLDKMERDEFDLLVKKVDAMSDSNLASYFEEEWSRSAANEPNYRHLHKRSRNVFRYAACAAIAALIAVGVTFLSFNSKDDDLLAESELSINSGEIGQMSMTLPDGTFVILNAHSSLSYPSDFGRNNRRITLEGEAFFDVAKDESKEFVVNAPGMEVSVHGTKFNVYAYPDSDYSEVSLLEGKVSVNCSDTQIKLNPGEKVCVNRSSSDAVCVSTDNEVETIWMKNKLTFIHDSLDHVFDVLERKFGVRIDCGENIDLTDLYTGSFRDTRINEILDIIKMHYGFKYEIMGNHIRIKK